MTDFAKLKVDADTESLERERIKSKLASLINSKDDLGERSLAKTTKLVNRFKKFYAETSLDNLVSEAGKLDLSMYMEEVISALLEAVRTMKLKDTFALVDVCAPLHSRYQNFGEQFLLGLRKLFDGFMNDNLRLRLYIRLLTELLLLDIVPKKLGEADLVAITGSVLTVDPDSLSLPIAVLRLTALSYWVSKYSESMISLPSAVRTHLESFYKEKAPRLVRSVTEAKTAQERVMSQQRIDKGQVDTENEEKFASLSSDLEKIQQNLSTIQVLLNFEPLCDIFISEEPTPETPKDASADSLSEPAEEITQFADETEKSFYQDIVNLAVRLPSSALVENSGSASSDGWSQFLLKFNACSSQEESDNLAVLWFETQLNSKANRSKLQQQLLKESSAYQCRFLATIAPFSKDLVATTVDDLKKKSLNMNERAVKTLGELIKFGLCPLGAGLELLQNFVNDFSPKSAEAAAWFLVSCGRFLVNHPQVGSIVDNLLTRLVKLTRSSATHVPAKVVMAVDDAYFQTKPKKLESSLQSTLSPLERYIQYLAEVELYQLSEDELLRLVRGLPWTSERATVESRLKGALLNLGLNANYVKVHCIASLLARLIKYQEAFVIDVIDTIMEQFQLGLEREDFRQAPARIRLARLIGELYAYRLIDSPTVLDLLYQLIGFRTSSSFGASEHTVLLELLSPKLHAIDEEGESESIHVLMHPGATDEPSWSIVRINLVSAILTTVGEFFLKGKNRTRILRYLVVFRRYVLQHCSSEKLPMRVVYVVNDLFDILQVRKLDIRADSIAQIDQELELLKSDLTDDRLEINSGYISETDSDGPVDESIEIMDIEEDHSPSAEESESDYERNPEEERDEEFESFDKEMQALMIDSLTEARQVGKKVNVSLPRNLDTKDSLDDDIQPGGFIVLSRRQGTAGLVVVPQDNKLRKGQEIYRLEQEAAAREKAQLKQYIMAYERASNDPKSVPATGHAVTLGHAAGIRSPQDIDRTRPRRVLRKF